MSENKHTPGPWMIYDDGTIASAAVRTPDHTVLLPGTVKGATIGEAMENARLIASAPELAHRANEWADMACNGIQWLRNIRDGISTPTEALAEMEANLARIRKLQANCR